MRILMTGPSSFTGMYFVEALAKAGHEVVVTCARPVECYEGVRQSRMQRVQRVAEVHPEIKFGDDRFLQLLDDEGFDVYCHHGAWTEQYRSFEYDIHRAFANNTRSIGEVCRRLKSNGCRKVLVSGSIFAEAEPVFSPYGLVKRMTTETVQLYGVEAGLQVSNVVIPNPFGPLDNPKLLRYLVEQWSQDTVPIIHTPDYVRDNIPVTLLAAGVADWIEQCPNEAGRSTFAPSGYVSTMRDFVERVATVFRKRLGWRCAVQYAQQTDFSQPMSLVNATSMVEQFSNWDELAFWESMVEEAVTNDLS